MATNTLSSSVSAELHLTTDESYTSTTVLPRVEEVSQAVLEIVAEAAVEDVLDDLSMTNGCAWRMLVRTWMKSQRRESHKSGNRLESSR